MWASRLYHLTSKPPRLPILPAANSLLSLPSATGLMLQRCASGSSATLRKVLRRLLRLLRLSLTRTPRLWCAHQLRHSSTG